MPHSIPFRIVNPAPVKTTWIRRRGAWAVLVALTLTAFMGCQRKETILDIETPGGEVEVERNVDTGAIDVKVDGDNPNAPLVEPKP